MFVEGLKLINFRNYNNLNIEFSKNLNVIYGNNGQGKTNILEALFLCASGRSHRTSKDFDLIRIGEKTYYIKLKFKKEDSDSNIEVSYEKDLKKRIKVNEIQVKKIGELIGQLNAVIFSPEDLLIIKEGPVERRRFIDITLSQLRPSYFFDLQQYSKILHQRNTLLKEIAEKNSLIDTLEVWDNNLVSVGSRIIKARHDFISRLSIKAQINHKVLSDGNEKLILKYAPSFDLKDYSNYKVIEDEFYKKLKVSYKQEIKRCITLFGPHRDDYDMFLDELNLKLYGSQGQQRTAILSIKLSEINIMKEENGENPVLLLDDVMSELDNKRQEILFSNILDIQTFITCTDKNFFTNKESLNPRYFYIEEGKIKEEV